MHAFTPDGKHLAFIDAFGLTRLSFPGKVKTDRKAMASPLAPLSLDAKGETLIAYDDGWDRSHLRSFPSLEPVVSLVRFELKACWMHPDGQHLLREETALKVLNLGRDEVASHDLTALLAKDLGTVKLGGNSEPVLGFAAAPDGAFAWSGRHGRFVVGTLDEAGKPPRAAFQGTLTGVAHRRIHALPSAAQTIFAAQDRAKGTLDVVRIPASGAVETFTLQAVGAPQLAGAALVYPRSAGEVVKLDLETKAKQVLTLPAELAREASERPGQVLAHPTRTLFVPWHAETFVELHADRPALTIDRKLPLAEQGVRRAVLDFFLAANQAGVATDVTFDLMRLDLKPGSYSPSFRFSRGDGSPAAKALAATTYAALGDAPMENLAGFQRGIYGSQG